MRKMFMALAAVAALTLLLSAHHLHADSAADASPYDWKPLDSIIGVPGVVKDEVDTFILPRTDLNVAVDSMEVPAGAGIASEFYFFHCSCGKMRVVGQFCCADYEANDVIDAIRAGAALQVSNVGPMFVSDKPRITIIRFQGEGDAITLAKLLKSGLGWMGESRISAIPTTQQGH